MTTGTIQSGALHLFYTDTGGPQPPLLLLHSLAENSRVFDAVLDAGLRDRFRCILPDLRGRGRSDRPETGYSLDAHCADLVALLDHLGLARVSVAGHSFGGLLGLYFAARHPDRVARLALLDAAVELHPMTPAFVLALTMRLGLWYPSEEAYLLKMRATPFMTCWDDRMAAALLADTEHFSDGTVYVRTQKHHIAQAAAAVQGIPKTGWSRMAAAFCGDALVLTAAEPFLAGQPVVPEEKAIETAVLFPRGLAGTVPGNHFTMLFKGAGALAEALSSEWSNPESSRPGRLEAVSGNRS